MLFFFFFFWRYVFLIAVKCLNCWKCDRSRSLNFFSLTFLRKSNYFMFLTIFKKDPQSVVGTLFVFLVWWILTFWSSSSAVLKSFKFFLFRWKKQKHKQSNDTFTWLFSANIFLLNRLTYHASCSVWKLVKTELDRISLFQLGAVTWGIFIPIALFGSGISLNKQTNLFDNEVNFTWQTNDFSVLLDLPGEMSLRATMWQIIHLSTCCPFLCSCLAPDHILQQLLHGIIAFLPLTHILLVIRDRACRAHCHGSWLARVAVSDLFFQAVVAPIRRVVPDDCDWPRRPEPYWPHGHADPGGHHGVRQMEIVFRLIERRWILAQIPFFLLFSEAGEIKGQIRFGPSCMS